MRFFIICFLILATLVSYSNIALSANILLWVFLVFLGYNIVKDRYMSLSSIFIFGLLYIYFKEILLNLTDLTNDWGIENVTAAYHIVMFSAITLLGGFYLNQSLIRKTKHPDDVPAEVFFILNRKKFFRITVVLTYLVFLGNIVLIYKGFTQGRQNAFEYGFLSALSYAIGVICIVNFKHYFRQFYGRDSYLKVLLCAAPIFLLYIGSGTRFLLLFGLMALINSSLFNLKLNKIVGLTFLLVAIGLMGNIFIQYRNVGLASGTDVEVTSLNTQNSINSKIVHYFTEEGVFRNAAMINDYTQKHDYTYGKSSSFILYFWIPRIFWSSKPTQIDYWLIREYTNEYDESGHSTASGFVGEVFMDFGKYFTVFLFFFVGIGLSKLNNVLLNLTINSYFKLVVSSAVIAWLFFAVRSVVTSSMMMLYIVLLAFIFSKIFKKWNLIK